MGTDLVAEAGLIKGNAVTLVLNSNSEVELKSWYQRLSAGGHITHPLAQNFWEGLFGGLTDKFGNHWLLHLT